MQHISALVHLIVKELILRKQTWTESDENLHSGINLFPKNYVYGNHMVNNNTDGTFQFKSYQKLLTLRSVQK